MTAPGLIAAMCVVIAGFCALAITDRASVRAAHPAWRRGAVAVWLVILVVGWAAFAYVALATPGGLDAAVDWFQAQSGPMRAAMWLFLLPWTGALAIWGSGLSEPVRVIAVLGVAVLTFVASAGLRRRS